MSSDSRRRSSLSRLGRSASSRLTEGLLSSSGKVAAVGLVTSIATLVFALWFGLQLRYDSEIATPMTRAAAVMNTAVNQSLVALRGWVAYGDPGALVERDRIWTEVIEPNLESLAKLAQESTDDETSQDAVEELRRSLRQLKLVQWAIGDVAHTPGNQPARVAYERRLEPLRRNILRGMRDAIEQYGASAQTSSSLAFLAELARFRAAFGEGDLALNDLIEEFTNAQEHSFVHQFELARNAAERLRTVIPERLGGDLRALVEYSLDEFFAYASQVGEVVALRRSHASSVAQLLFVHDAQPLLLRARSTASQLAQTQAAKAMEDAERLSRASYAVIALATLMGILSAGSLFVSLRLRRQVQDVMARAKRLGQYEIERKVGQGGMGEVYLAHHAMLRRPTAIKLLRAENSQDVRAQTRFQREVQLTSQLTHPNTIEIFDYGRTPTGIFYYAMEYVDGFTLDALVSLAGPVDARRVVHTLVQTCGSLQEAHERGVLHRDIKPSNIMLTERGGIFDTVKILDFGLVKELRGGAGTEGDKGEVIVGTPMYMAPELILSSDSASPQSDLYALGAVGYLLLAGTTPFPVGNVVETLSHHLGDDPPFPSERLGQALPESLEYVLMACLAKDPAQRPASAADLVALLRACECGSWSDEDARLWWEEFGEAARNELATQEGKDSVLRSGLEVVVEDTRA